MSAQRQTTGGKQDVQKTERQKGFTLVELIVVLVILAILAALLIPALTGYIDKANKEKVVSETRMVAMAVQTELSEAYGQAGAGKDLTGVKWENADTKGKEHIDSIKNLAEVVDLTTTTFKATASKDGALKTVSYNDGVYTCVYDASKKTYTTTKSADKLDNTVTIE